MVFYVDTEQQIISFRWELLSINTLKMKTDVNCFVVSSTSKKRLTRYILSKLIHNKTGGRFFDLLSDMYSKSKCAIRYGNKRTNFVSFDREVRQWCILSPLLFNLCSNELPTILDSQDTNPITLPNGSPLSGLFYVGDLVLIILTSENGKKIPRKDSTQFYKHYLGLNRRAPNVASRNQKERLYLKLNIYLMILKFWIHLENLPENSIAGQFLKLSVN